MENRLNTFWGFGQGGVRPYFICYFTLLCWVSLKTTVGDSRTASCYQLAADIENWLRGEEKVFTGSTIKNAGFTLSRKL